MKKLLITKCSDAHKWYANKIGQYVDYLGTSFGEYKSREDAGYVNFVSIEDAEIVDMDLQKKKDYYDSVKMDNFKASTKLERGETKL